MNFKVDISVCRVCMKSESGISLFKERGLYEKFVYTTKLKVKEEDSMPSILCKKCVVKLKIAYDFCRLAISSEKHLRKFLHKISADFQKVAKIIPGDDDESTWLMEDADVDDENVHALIEEACCLDQIVDQSKTTKDELTEVSEELEVVEVRENIAAKTEVFEHEIFMEEFHEIIQEDNCDSNIYLDENSAEELQLYEDGSELYEDEQREEEIDENVADSQELGSSVDGLDEKLAESKPTKKTVKKKAQRSGRKKYGQSASAKLEGKSNICIKCNKDFSTKTNLMRHMSTHDGVRPYQCNICGKGFTQNGSLKQHMFIHTGERPHVCHVCKRGFTQSKSLIFHMRRHTGEKPFTCEECGISFRQKDGLKHHVQKYHSGMPSSPERHACCVCNRILSSKYSLSVHMRKHAAKQEASSDIGSEKKPEVDFDMSMPPTSSVEDLTSPQPPESEQEPQTATSSASLEKSNICTANDVRVRTITVASGQRIKQFQCGKCFKSFNIKRNLLRHLRNHDVGTLELHECEDCKIGFDTRRALKLHRQRDHNDVISDLNNCEYCNVPYATVAELSKHVANVHDSIDQNCPHCNESFKSQKLYYDHLLEHEHMLED